MDSRFKNALDRVKAHDALKQKTADYIRSLDANVIQINSAASLRKKHLYVKRLVAAACAAAILCALPIAGYAAYQTPASYVSIDINPSIELGINAFGTVIRVTPFNADGETVVSGLPLLHKNVETAVRLIVRSAAQNGFIKDDGSSFVAVTAETNNDTAAEKLEVAAKSGAEAAITSENDDATVSSEHIGLDRRDAALVLGISPGKLNLIEKLQSLDPSITVDTYKNATVADIQKKFTELKKDHKNDSKGEDTDPSNSAKSPSSSAPSAAGSTTTPSSPTETSSKPNGNNGNHNGNGNNNESQNNNGISHEATIGMASDNENSDNANNGNTTNHGKNSDSGNNSKNNGNSNNNRRYRYAAARSHILP